MPTVNIGGFDPRNISGCKAWLRSDLGITLNGSNVSAWANQVPSVSANMTQATPANQPAYNSGGLGGNPKITFNGSSHVLNWALTLGGAKTVIVVLQSASDPGAGLFRVLYSIGNGSGAIAIRFQGNSASYPLDFWVDDGAGGGATGTVGYNVAWGTNPLILCNTYNAGTNTATTSYTASRNGLSVTNSLSTGSTLAGQPAGVFGADVTNSRYFAGDVYEVLVYNRALSPDEQTAIFGYMRQRYGIFDPRSISGCRCWLRSDLGVTLNGSTVSNWANQVSGVSGDASQATGAKQPTYNLLGGQNGLPRITFGGTHALEWALDLQGAMTVALVYKLSALPVANSTEFGMMALKGSTGPVWSVIDRLNAFTGYKDRNWLFNFTGGVSTGSTVGNATAVSTNFEIDIIGFDGAGFTTANYTEKLNNIDQTLASSGAFNLPAANLGSLGGYVDSGHTITGGMQGDLYEVIVYNRNLTATERAQLSEYLRYRYNFERPTDIWGCKAWLRSDMGITLNGSTVSAWADQSGNGNGATQASAGLQPTYVTANGANGRPLLRFGGAHPMQWPLNLQGAKTVFGVYKVNTPLSNTFYGIYNIKGSTGPVFSEGLLANSGGYLAQSIEHDVGNAATASVGSSDVNDLGEVTVFVHTYNGGAISSTTSYTSTTNGALRALAASGNFSRTLTDLGSLGGRLDSVNTPNVSIHTGLFGDIYELAAWNRVLTTDEINSLWTYAQRRYGVGKADLYKQEVRRGIPVGYWRLNETTGTTALDNSGAGNAPGTYTNAWTLQQTPIRGDINNMAAAAAAANSEISVGNVAALSFEYTSPFSLEAWVKTTDVTTTPIILSKNGYNGGAFSGYWLQLYTSTSVRFLLSNNFAVANYGDWTGATGTVLNDGNWHHVVMSWSGGTPNLYIDGVACTITTLHSGPSATVLVSNPFLIGNYDFTGLGSGANITSGTVLDELAVYDYALTPAEVAAHYKATPFDPRNISGCVSWLKSDSGVVLSGGTAVTNWVDIVSPGTNDASQSSAGLQPVYTSSGGLNNKPYLTFDGTKGMQWSVTTPSSGRTVIVVAKPSVAVPTNDGWRIVVLKHGTLADILTMINAAGWDHINVSSDITIGGANQTFFGSNTPAFDTLPHVWVYTYNGGGNLVGNYAIDYDNSVLTLGAASPYNAATVGFGSIGAEITGANAVVATTGFKGDYYEIIVYNRVLTTNELTSLYRYLKHRYAL